MHYESRLRGVCMDILQTISVLVAVVSLLTNVIDLLAKIKNWSPKMGFGLFPKKLNKILWIITAVSFGFGIGYYVQESTINKLHYDISALQNQKAKLDSNQTMNIRIRDKALKFFQEQMQISAEEFDRISGRSIKNREECVILYEHDNYQGIRLYFPIGNYSDLHLYWFGDRASSIKFHGNVKAVAYEDTLYGRRQLYIQGDIPSLRELNANWNDRISSIKVLRRNKYDTF